MNLIRRRGLLAVLFCISVVAAVGSARAQDPRGSMAQNEARNWLVLTDRGDSVASWRAAGKKFQSAITDDRWGESLRQVRPPLGALTDRTLLSTQFTTRFPGTPEGDYALLVFRSSFAKKTDAQETVTLEREADGAWRVIGYFIR